MESIIQIKSTFEEIDKLFNDSNNISIRHYKELKLNKYEVTVRHSHYREEDILKCKTIEKLSEINETEFQYYKSQFSKINTNEEVLIKLYTEEKVTNVLTLNLESIKELKKLINKIEKKLKGKVDETIS